MRLEAILGRLSVHVEEAVARGDTDLACAILCRIGDRSLRLDDDETDRVFMLTIRRLARGRLVRAIASRLPSVTAERKLLLAILAHAGDEGADAVIEHLVAQLKSEAAKPKGAALTNRQAASRRCTTCRTE